MSELNSQKDIKCLYIGRYDAPPSYLGELISIEHLSFES